MPDIKLSLSSNVIDESNNESSSNVELRKEIIFLKAQLEESQKAFATLSKTDKIDPEKDSSIITEDDFNVQKESSNVGEKETDQESKMVHVQMLDAENFVTEWNNLGPLPPPPDHDLYSPIVLTLLKR